jgi:hypothetical protein
MRRVSMVWCLVTVGLGGYGAVGLGGLAAGVSVGVSQSGTSDSAAGETITASEIIASRFPAPMVQDVAPAQVAMLRAAAVSRADGIVTPSTRVLRSVALRYGVLESGLRPSELAPAGTAEAIVASSPMVTNIDGTASWHEAFIARMLTADQAANFTVLPAAATVAIVESREAPAPDRPHLTSTPQPVVAPHRRAHPGGVLNDAQIANIKSRLNLTPEQERMWPAVEVALRNISYAKTASAQSQAAHDSRMAYVDPSGPEVQQLKYAALPLIMRLSDDQKREVQSLAHVMGLDSILSAATAWF